MKKLWAPWRNKYIKIKTKKGCLFCRLSKSKKDRSNLIIQRTKFSFSMLNLFPYNNGHMMISPFRHVKDMRYLKEEEILDLVSLLNKMENLLEKVLKPQGFNFGVNIGKCAGCGYAGHLHIHIVPRFEGDANFMPAVINTKVISQSLETLYKSLKNIIKKSEA
jgi:ATP adenylyltransferase